MPTQAISRRIVSCARCDRLRDHCERIASVKKREFRNDTYWGKPVPGFGDPHARLWIVGLAPAAHGANRTGRVFTGDMSGHWLFGALHEFGFANQAKSVSRKDGLELKDVFISAAARCAPPGNKPLPDELTNCAPFLDAELKALRRARVVMTLGSIAFKAVLAMLQREGATLPRPAPRFGHILTYKLGRRYVLACYHPSRQNTQTGRLTKAMWSAAFESARELLEEI